MLLTNRHFDVSTVKSDDGLGAKLFSVPDFVGDICKAIASRIRGAVAAVPFDQFHKRSITLIQGAVFGFKDGKPLDLPLRVGQNNLGWLYMRNRCPQRCEDTRALSRSTREAKQFDLRPV